MSDKLEKLYQELSGLTVLEVSDSLSCSKTNGA